MSVNIQEYALAFGNAQADNDIATPSTTFTRFSKVDREPLAVDLKSEDDSDDIGKDDEFVTQNFLTNWDVGGRVTKYCTYEWLTFLFQFGLGGPGGTFQNPVTSGIELPYFSMIEAFRPSGTPAVLNRMLIGCMLGSWTVRLTSGTGRKNATTEVEIHGSGRHGDGVTLPAEPIKETRFDAGSMTATIQNTDYRAAKSLVSLEFGVRNNPRLNDGFFPGSGEQDGAQVRGRIEFGKREPYLRYVARYEEGSPELDLLLSQVEGTSVIGLSGGTHSATATFNRIVTAGALLRESNGILTVAVESKTMKDATNGVATFVTA